MKLNRYDNHFEFILQCRSPHLPVFGVSWINDRRATCELYCIL